MKRYYCRGAEGPEGHCDNRKHTIQCDHCIWKEQQITNPYHGGKVTCHTCQGFITNGDEVGYWSFQHRDEYPHVHFHKDCYNPYEHYYGLDKPID